MIESNIIEWLDFGESVHILDAYSNKGKLFFFKFFKTLLKNRNYPLLLNIFFLLLYFIQIWLLSIFFFLSKEENILGRLNYLKQFIIFFDFITKENYVKIFIIIFLIILIDFILMIFVLFSNKNRNLFFSTFIINLMNSIIIYFLIGPAILIFLTSIFQGNKILNNSNYSILLKISSIIMILLYIFISFLFSFYGNRIDTLKTNNKDNINRINCNYETFCLISKIVIYCLGFFFKSMGCNFLSIILYHSFLFINNLIMSIYTYHYVYYYNNIINSINHYGWHISTWLSFCALLQNLLKLKNISIIIIIGWIIINLVLNKIYTINENMLFTEMNYFEFSNIKSIIIYINISLKHLLNQENIKSKILISGIIKKFENYIINNQELNYSYQKLKNNKDLIVKVKNEEYLSILSIIFIIYSFYLDNPKIKDEIPFYFCYFLINNLNNPVYSMLLCSKSIAKGHKASYNKYLLTEDIKEYLNSKLENNSHKDSIQYVQFGKVILYYLYAELLKIKIYDCINYQIDYFDILKNKNRTDKITENFLKNGKNILKERKEIIFLWQNLIEINPFDEDTYNDYMLYINSIIQDEFLVQEEYNKYIILKNIEIQEKNNINYKIFLNNISAVLLISSENVIYTTKNFSSIFGYNEKEASNLILNNLIPNTIKAFHKELMDNAIKYTNFNNIFNKQKDSLLENNNGELYNINLFVKPVPNLFYGLIFFVHLEKINEHNLIILLDKELKISCFTQIQTSSFFTMNNGYNLSHEILGNHIGVIIPDIVPLLEYKNSKFKINKKDYELKGNLYSFDKEIKNKISTILDKVKNNQDQLEEIPDDINEIKQELNNKNIKYINIFYKIKKYSFLKGKYKYYRVYVKNNLISGNEYGLPLIIENEIFTPENKSENSIQSKKKENKVIKIDNIIEKSSVNYINNTENKTLSEKGSHEGQNIIKSQTNSNKNKINIIEHNKIKLSQINFQPNSFMLGINQIKLKIINETKIFPMKMMKLMLYIFSILILFFMILQYIVKKNAYNQLSIFLEQNLFFNQTKNIIAILYTLVINVKWISHSLYIKESKCPNYNCSRFYQAGILENINILKSHRENFTKLDENFKDILNQKFLIKFDIYKYNESETYYFNYDNFLIFIINSGYYLLKIFLNFTNVTTCIEISKDFGIDEITINNLIEQLYNFYYLNLDGYSGEEKLKKINKIIEIFPVSLLASGLIITVILYFYLYYSISIYKTEKIFVIKLINFNSPSFDKYIKLLDTIKNQLKHDNNQEKEEDDLKNESKKTNILVYGEQKIKDNNKKKRKSILSQQKQNKLNMMIFYFKRENIMFGIKIIITMTIILSYYLVFLLIDFKFKNNYINFDTVNVYIEKVFKDSYNIFIPLKRELELYERNLINCTTLGTPYQLKLPIFDNLKIPILEDFIMQILEDPDFKQKTIEEFQTIFNEDICKDAGNPLLLNDCHNFWTGILSKGMRQSIAYLNTIIGNVLDELKSLNDDNKSLFNLISEPSSYFEYEIFNEYYLNKISQKAKSIFATLRKEKLEAIYKTQLYILLVYILLLILIFFLLMYYLYNYKNIFISFINFLGIVPLRYISEDKNLSEEIIKFGNNFY